VYYTVGLRNLLSGITQNGVVSAQGFGKFLVFLRGVNAGSKIGDVKLFDYITVLTERLALCRSPACERLRKPG